MKSERWGTAMDFDRKASRGGRIKSCCWHDKVALELKILRRNSGLAAVNPAGMAWSPCQAELETGIAA
jgi:hypothetical protein